MKQQDGRNLKVTSQKKEAFFQIEIVQIKLEKALKISIEIQTILSVQLRVHEPTFSAITAV